MEASCLVYPRPDDAPLPLHGRHAHPGEASAAGTGDEDFAGLRPYQLGDSPRRVAWKASGRGDALLTKQFTGQASEDMWLDWAALPAHLDVEARLSRLTGWVLQADRRRSATAFVFLAASSPRLGRSASAALSRGAGAVRSGPDATHEEGSAAAGFQRHSLLFAVLLAAAPHALHLPKWVLLLATSLWLWRVYLLHRDLRLPNRWLLSLFTIAGSVGIFFHYRSFLGRDAGVTLLVLMLALKLLEMRAAAMRSWSSF